MSEHNPGGRSTFTLPPGVVGSAALSKDGLCRFILTRELEDSTPSIAIQWLWIGLNPSTATPDLDDPTIRVEWNLTQKEEEGTRFVVPGQRKRYTKMNVLPFRVTDPANLENLMLGLDIHPDEREEHLGRMQALAVANMAAIVEECGRADRVIVAWGHPRSKIVAWQCMQLLSMIRQAYTGVIWCVGILEENWPAHPLRRKCVLQPYRVNPALGGVSMERIMAANSLQQARDVRQRS